jgi:hypothetical protein
MSAKKAQGSQGFTLFFNRFPRALFQSVRIVSCLKNKVHLNVAALSPAVTLNLF